MLSGFLHNMRRELPPAEIDRFERCDKFAQALRTEPNVRDVIILVRCDKQDEPGMVPRGWSYYTYGEAGEEWPEQHRRTRYAVLRILTTDHLRDMLLDDVGDARKQEEK